MSRRCTRPTSIWSTPIPAARWSAARWRAKRSISATAIRWWSGARPMAARSRSGFRCGARRPRPRSTRIYRRLIRSIGEERAHRMAKCARNLLIFPNLVLNDIMSITVRMFQPTAPDYMEVSVWSLAPVEEIGKPALARRLDQLPGVPRAGRLCHARRHRGAGVLPARRRRGGGSAVERPLQGFRRHRRRSRRRYQGRDAATRVLAGVAGVPPREKPQWQSRRRSRERRSRSF